MSRIDNLSSKGEALSAIGPVFWTETWASINESDKQTFDKADFFNRQHFYFRSVHFRVKINETYKQTFDKEAFFVDKIYTFEVSSFDFLS